MLGLNQILVRCSPDTTICPRGQFSASALASALRCRIPVVLDLSYLGPCRPTLDGHLCAAFPVAARRLRLCRGPHRHILSASLARYNRALRSGPSKVWCRHSCTGLCGHRPGIHPPPSACAWMLGSCLLASLGLLHGTRYSSSYLFAHLWIGEV